MAEKEKIMGRKATSILSYFTISLWLIACSAGDKEGAKFHLNQSLVLHLIFMAWYGVGGILTIIPVINIIWGVITCIASIAWFVFWVMGLIYAIQQEEKPLPLFGKINLMY